MFIQTIKNIYKKIQDIIKDPIKHLLIYCCIFINSNSITPTIDKNIKNKITISTDTKKILQLFSFLKKYCINNDYTMIVTLEGMSNDKRTIYKSLSSKYIINKNTINKYLLNILNFINDTKENYDIIYINKIKVDIIKHNI
jgi:hypothetical protein